MGLLESIVPAMAGAIAPTLWVYVRAFFANWLRVMSGGASVAFAVGTALTSNVYAQLTLALFALLCGLYATYQIWKPDRQRVCELEEKLKHKIRLRFAERQQKSGWSTPHRHVFVENLSPYGIEQCQVMLENVECKKGGGPYELVPHFQAALPLGWCFLKFEDPQKYSPQLLPPKGHLVDLLTADPDARLLNGLPFFK